MHVPGYVIAADQMNFRNAKYHSHTCPAITLQRSIAGSMRTMLLPSSTASLLSTGNLQGIFETGQHDQMQHIAILYACLPPNPFDRV